LQKYILYLTLISFIEKISLKFNLNKPIIVADAGLHFINISATIGFEMLKFEMVNGY
jgi:hypothetical protein